MASTLVGGATLCVRLSKFLLAGLGISGSPWSLLGTRR